MTKKYWACVEDELGVYCVTTEPNDEVTLAGLAKFAGRPFGLFASKLGADEWHFGNIEEVCTFLRYREVVKRAAMSRGALE